MTIQEITNAYAASPQVKELLQQLSTGDDRKDFFLHGLIGSQDAFVAASVFKQCDYNHLFVMSDKEEAAYFQNNLKNLLGSKDIFFFPDSFRRPQDFTELNNNNVLLRTETVNRLSNSNSKAELAVTYAEALFEKVVRQEVLNEQTLRMKVNEKLDIDFMIDLLVEFEFEWSSLITLPIAANKEAYNI